MIRMLPVFRAIFFVAGTGVESEKQTSSSADVESVQFNISESHLIGGFAIGVQSYTFNRYSAFEAIEMTAKAGGRIIEMHRQKVWPDEDDDT